MENFNCYFQQRFNQKVDAPTGNFPLNKLNEMLARGSCRQFKPDLIDENVFQVLCAAALSSPTKSDLQQRDIILLREPKRMAELKEIVAGDELWIKEAPNIAIFCGNNRRQRLLHELRGHPFANDHLDAFFNAAVDAGVALSAFVIAAEAIGLGCCPISAIRNDAQSVSDLLNLPEHVFPVAGLAFGLPANSESTVSIRLPLAATVHMDTYNDQNIRDHVGSYDVHREQLQPYKKQRDCETFGIADTYSWSEEKARQYALPERQTFGEFIRSKGFNLK